MATINPAVFQKVFFLVFLLFLSFSFSVPSLTHKCLLEVEILHISYRCKFYVVRDSG